MPRGTEKTKGQGDGHLVLQDTAQTPWHAPETGVPGDRAQAESLQPHLLVTSVSTLFFCLGKYFQTCNIQEVL